MWPDLDKSVISCETLLVFSFLCCTEANETLWWWKFPYFLLAWNVVQTLVSCSSWYYRQWSYIQHSIGALLSGALAIIISSWVFHLSFIFYKIVFPIHAKKSERYFHRIHLILMALCEFQLIKADFCISIYTWTCWKWSHVCTFICCGHLLFWHFLHSEQPRNYLPYWFSYHIVILDVLPFNVIRWQEFKLAPKGINISH